MVPRLFQLFHKTTARPSQGMGMAGAIGSIYSEVRNGAFRIVSVSVGMRRRSSYLWNCMNLPDKWGEWTNSSINQRKEIGYHPGAKVLTYHVYWGLIIMNRCLHHQEYGIPLQLKRYGWLMILGGLALTARDYHNPWATIVLAMFQYVLEFFLGAAQLL